VIVLDTNVISEMVKPAPHPAVVRFLRRLNPTQVYTTAICEAEIRFGLARMEAGKRRIDLTRRIDTFFAVVLQNQVLPFDSESASLYGEIRSERQASGAPMEAEDAMIAATARAAGATLITRNVKDFVACGTPVVDPWNEGAAG
jgi:predicted nucleic acid-binding protein